ncbi:Threonine synthase-like 2 [Porites harrisoni]
MKYRSTRGKVEATSFEDVLFSGYAGDGGLFMPECIPVVDRATLEKWKGLSYLELTKEVMSLFIPPEEITSEDLNDLINKAFSEFGHKDLLSIAKVNNFHVLELSHGKTLAFKDYALVSVGMFMDFFLKKKKKNTIVLVGTSGDTGSAAIESVRRSEWIDIIVLFPKGRANQIQELQMTTVTDSNVHVFSTEGTSDDLDKPIKNCFSDHEYAETNNLSSINSINWCRILAQLVHIFYAYFQVCQEVGDTVKFIIPTGALGHCTAGLYVHKMGLPVELVCAVNENDIVHRAISTGVFTMSEVVQQTWSTAMDIQVM